jgi:glycosyltransferase involved in cell wall biosynthesis
MTTLDSELEAETGPKPSGAEVARVPRVGVVVPAYNAERFLGATMRSIASQTFTDWRCVVVNDGSTDRTGDIALTFAATDPRFTVVSQANVGLPRARNRGFEELHPATEFVSFMDADDMWRPAALEVLVEAAESTMGAVGAHALGDFVDENGVSMLPGAFVELGRGRKGCRGGWPRKWSVECPTTFENVIVQSILFPPGLAILKVDAFREAGLFDPEHADAEDWDMFIRITRLGDLAFVNRVLLDYRRHGSNMGAGSERATGVAKAFRAAYFSPSNTEEHRRLLRDAWRARQVLDARARARRAKRAIRRREPRTFATEFARLPLITARYVRGEPPQPGRLL